MEFLKIRGFPSLVVDNQSESVYNGAMKTQPGQDAETPAEPKRRRLVNRSPDGRKVFGLEAIGQEVGLGKDATLRFITSGELDVCKKRGATWWAYVADLDRWLEEQSS